MTKGTRILTQHDLNLVIRKMDKPRSCSWDRIDGKPSFSAVAISGDYADIKNKPVIPAPVNLSPLTERISSLESVTSSFVIKFGVGKAQSIAPITSAPENVVEISALGIGLKLGAASSVNSLRNEFIKLRDSHNALLAACKSWGWMAT